VGPDLAPVGRAQGVVTLDPGRVVADLPELRVGNRAQVDDRRADFFRKDFSPRANVGSHLDDEGRAAAWGLRDNLETAFESRSVLLVHLGDVGAKDAVAPGKFPRSDAYPDGFDRCAVATETPPGKAESAGKFGPVERLIKP
jgi:hypothetical protein